jgi:hypothetical protein
VPQFYIPVAQDAPLSMKFVLRTSTNPLADARAASETLRKLDPEAVISRIGTTEDRTNGSVKGPYFHTVIEMFFGWVRCFLPVLESTASLFIRAQKGGGRSGFDWHSG